LKSTWLAALKGFVLGEACLQLLNAVTGLLLVRWMSVEQYAQYALANAFQSGAQQFVKFGLVG
jgi:O-antigen/teichoic acid export membrane protein